MIAAWMLGSVLVAAILMLAARVTALAARALNKGERFVWLGALVLAVGISATRLSSTATADRSDLPDVSAAASVFPQQAITPASPMAAVLKAAAPKLRPAVRVSYAVPVPPALTVLDTPLLFLWAAASFVWAMLLLLSAARLRRQRTTWQPLMLDGAPVYVSHDVGPALFGIMRHSIVVPSWVAQIEENRRRLILAHEREHARAADPMVLLAGACVVLLQPWNPAAWMMFKRLRLAVETDCDARVLAGSPDVRAYGDLLLDIGERTVGGLAPVAALSEPHSFLARRIDLMTRHPVSRPRLRSLLSASAGSVAVLAAYQIPLPALDAHAHRTARVIVRINAVGLEEAGPSPSIVVYTVGDALVGLGTNPPTQLLDTLRLRRLPAMTLDVTDGDVHVELVGDGRLSIGGDVSGGPATHLSATGHHVVVLKGGLGIDPGFNTPSSGPRTSLGPSGSRACASLATTTSEIHLDTLRALARRLHPEVFARGVGDSAVTVALLFDANCQLSKQIAGRRPSDHLSVQDALAAIMPGAPIQRIRSGGFMELRDSKPGSPWLVWGVQADSIPR